MARSSMDVAPWSATEAINFLASGKPVSLDEAKRRADRFHMRWGTRHDLRDLLDRLDAIGDGNFNDLPSDDVDFMRERQNTISFHEGGRFDLRHLREMLREDLSTRASVIAATRALVNACRAGKVTASGQRRCSQSEIAAPIPKLAWVPGIYISDSDEMRPDPACTLAEFARIKGMRPSLFVNLTFEASDIRDLRPPEAAAARLMERSGPVAIERARHWMHLYFEAHPDPKPKRGPTILLCRDEAGVTEEVARAAWNAMPKELRIGVGRRS